MKPKFLQHPPSSATIRRIMDRGAQADATEPRVRRARYDAETEHLVMDLRGGYVIAIPKRALGSGLRTSDDASLQRVRVQGAGSVIFWPALDDGFDVQEMLGSILSVGTAAAALGRRGGKAQSPQKIAAARANGQRGGRPRKHNPPAVRPSVHA